MPRLAFAGTPAFAATILQAMIEAGWEIPLVISQPPALAGRGRVWRESAVATMAQEAGLQLATPQRIAELAALIASLKLEALVVAAYGQIIPASVFTSPTHGTINVHASLLPRYRGASPVSAAIMAGDAMTGVSLMQIEAGLDTGPVYSSQEMKIRSDDTTGSLTERLAATGADLLVTDLPRILNGDLTAEPQNHLRASHAPPSTKQSGRLDWSMPVIQIERQVRAMQPWPGAWTTYGNTRVEVLSGSVVKLETPVAAGRVLPTGIVAAGNGGYQLETIKPAGKGEMRAADWCRNLPKDAQFE